MATFAFTDAYVSINSVDLSDHVRSVTINVEAEDLEDTAMGSTFRSRIGGLKDWSLDIEFNQDFDFVGGGRHDLAPPGNGRGGGGPAHVVFGVGHQPEVHRQRARERVQPAGRVGR